MDSKIQVLLDDIVKSEGGYVDHPDDRGGATKYGITQATLASWRGKAVTKLDVKNLTVEEARDIYYKRYVVAPGFDKVLALSPTIGCELVDAGVLSGPARPVKWLQRVLNAMNNKGILYPDVIVDGQLGPKTIKTLELYLKSRGYDATKVMVRALNCLQGEFMIAISESRTANEAFTYGWLLHRVS